MELPQVQDLMMSWRRMLKAQCVLVAVSDRELVCSWKASSGWVWRSAVWPPDSCRGGMPLRREPMGELLADLLLDCDIVGAEIALLLPLGACTWRVLDGVHLDKLEAANFSYLNLGGHDAGVDSKDVYRSYLAISDSVVVVSTPRPTLQSWIDVIELADLPLRRVTWTLSSAFQAVQRVQPLGNGPVAWLIQHSESSTPRLILLRDGIPEVDRQLHADMDLRHQVQQTIDAWMRLSQEFVSLTCWLTSPESEVEELSNLLLGYGNLLNLSIDSVWCPKAWSPELETAALDPLAHLALIGAWQETH